MVNGPQSPCSVLTAWSKVVAMGTETAETFAHAMDIFTHFTQCNNKIYKTRTDMHRDKPDT